jgi:hypothetical protein
VDTRSDRAERGSATLEYVGILLVVAALVAGLTAALVPAPVARGAACAISRMLSQAGDCSGPGTPVGFGPTGPVGPDAPPVDEEKVDRVLVDVRDALAGGLLGVRSGDLERIQDLLDGLSGPELDAVVAGMSDAELEQWVDELDDGSIVGSGWSRERRRELWSMIASRASEDTMRRLARFTDEVQPDFEDVGGDDAAVDPQSPARNATYGDLQQVLFLPGDDGTGVHPDDVRQGAIGDCWLVASMAALAQQRPDLVEDMIRLNDNGTYTVTLYDDGRPVQVTVTPDFPLLNGRPVFATHPT